VAGGGLEKIKGSHGNDYEMYCLVGRDIVAVLYKFTDISGECNATIFRVKEKAKQGSKQKAVSLTQLTL
jgi:hypothetical protein